MYDLHNQLVHWATIAPEHSSIVEAETGRSITYSHCLSAVQHMRQFLGVQPRNLMLTLSGGIADAVLWLRGSVRTRFPLISSQWIRSRKMLWAK